MIIMGHRGAAALEPENTLLSIMRAMKLGVDAVEIDVRSTGDHELVVIHDATVDRTTNGKGEVRSYTLKEIKRLDAGKGEPIPTLKEVMDLTAGKVNVIIELKEEGLEPRVVQIIEEYDACGRVSVISFWHDAVRKLKLLDRRIRTGVLMVGCPVDTCVAESALANVFVMNYAFVNAAFIQLAHEEGLQVIVWNIDDPALIKRYVDMDVDGIGSNDPRILVDYFRAVP